MLFIMYKTLVIIDFIYESDKLIHLPFFAYIILPSYSSLNEILEIIKN